MIASEPGKAASGSYRPYILFRAQIPAGLELCLDGFCAPFARFRAPFVAVSAAAQHPVSQPCYYRGVQLPYRRPCRAKITQGLVSERERAGRVSGSCLLQKPADWFNRFDAGPSPPDLAGET